MDPTTVVDGFWLIVSESTRHQVPGHSTRTTSFGSPRPENSWTSGAPWWDPALGRYTVDVVAVDRMCISKSKLHRQSCQAFNRWTFCRANEERLWRCLCRYLITKSKHPRQWLTTWKVASETPWANMQMSGSRADLLMSDRCNALRWPRRWCPWKCHRTERYRQFLVMEQQVRLDLLINVTLVIRVVWCLEQTRLI